MPEAPSLKVLAADIGGTNTTLQVAEIQGNTYQPLYQRHFVSQDYADFDSLLRLFWEQGPKEVLKGCTRACVAAAGPLTVADDGTRSVQVTNLLWKLEDRALQTLLDIDKLLLVNDFQAMATSIDHLGQEHLMPLNTASPLPEAPQLVVGAGTGLGVAQRIWTRNGYHTYPSEGGHIHFAPLDDHQLALLHYMQREYGHVSYERLVSGPGLTDIYRFLCQRAHKADPLRTLSKSADPGAEIAARAHQGKAFAKDALALFMAVYGAVVGDLALVTLPYGGIYIAGGIAPKLLSELKEGPFLQAYGAKGRLSPLLQRMPLYVLLHPQAGLLGAAFMAARA